MEGRTLWTNSDGAAVLREKDSSEAVLIAIDEVELNFRELRDLRDAISDYLRRRR
jgi:hypothetical protein